MTQIHKKKCDRLTSFEFLSNGGVLKKGLLVASILGLFITFILIVHNVSEKVTPQDKLALKKLLPSIDKKRGESFQDEINFILTVQDTVLDASKPFIKIPLKHTREPYDLIFSGHGQCGDRGRTIEKALRFAGFETRFFSLYSRDKTFIPKHINEDGSGRNSRSHALVEVKTSKGWVVVDTNERWISLDINNNPVSIEEWQKVKDKNNFKWSPKNIGGIYWILQGNFIIIYGLYSGHGKFYPPYTPYIPDISLKTMIKGHLF